MTIKENLLVLFESERGVYFSGEEIAKRLSVSRAAVWKAVKSLQNDGYVIDAVPSRGYCLAGDTDILSVQGIQKYLLPQYDILKLHTLTETTSTNTLVREQASLGASEGYIVVAGKQTGGRGRRGRSFYSPSGSGIYLSLLLRPCGYSPMQAVRLTTMAAVAMCETLDTETGTDAKIKWVNDIFVNEKKVCGILTEAAMGLENESLEYAVLGVGLNVYPPEGGFPKELEQIAGTVYDSPHPDAKNRLTAGFLNHFMAYYSDLGQTAYSEKYRSKSFVIGREVNVLRAEQSQPATVLGIDDECRLLVRYKDGREEALSSGEISIRFS